MFIRQLVIHDRPISRVSPNYQQQVVTDTRRFKTLKIGVLLHRRLNFELKLLRSSLPTFEFSFSNGLVRRGDCFLLKIGYLRTGEIRSQISIQSCPRTTLWLNKQIVFDVTALTEVHMEMVHAFD